ncbi:ATP synthase subunit I [Pandoraea thiooxydans]|nr:ATP synthase subunit I [Pandoraea thiooxydans]
MPGVFFALRLKVSRDRLTVSSLVIGEAIKVMTTIALFVAIATLYPAVHWVALLTTFVLVLKAHWLALAIK